MIIKLKQDIECSDIEVKITYPVKNRTVDRIISAVKSAGSQLECYSDDIVKKVNISDIFYIESIDKKTIAFCEIENFTIKDRLYQVYEKIKEKGFVQISKQCILNINKLDKIKSLANSHLEAMLTNGKNLYVTRKYLAKIKQVLQEEE